MRCTARAGKPVRILFYGLCLRITGGIARRVFEDGRYKVLSRTAYSLYMEERVSIKMANRIQLYSRIFFMLYMLVLLYFLLFSDWYGRANATEEYHYNLTLFKEIRRFWVYRHKLGAMAVFTNLVGNVICFMPYGFVLPELHKIFRNGFLVIFSGFVVTLGVETDRKSVV